MKRDWLIYLVMFSLALNLGTIGTIVYLRSQDRPRLAADPAYDVVLTDHAMPEMDGVTLLETLRAANRHRAATADLGRPGSSRRKRSEHF